METGMKALIKIYNGNRIEVKEVMIFCYSDSPLPSTATGVIYTLHLNGNKIEILDLKEEN